MAKRIDLNEAGKMLERLRAAEILLEEKAIEYAFHLFTEQEGKKRLREASLNYAKWRKEYDNVLNKQVKGA